ncbi:MAG: hypothetical protein JWM07_41 [Candidatus Saccharibacteria bacterium]|nr:hypothetical protein [Candidatus Saccharibacteria bacterium]
MIEVFIVRMTEIMLSATAFIGIAVIFFATLHDLRAINQKNRASESYKSPTDIPKGISALTRQYLYLNKAIFKKTIPSRFLQDFYQRHIYVIRIVSFTASLFTVLLVTYFFYTAATLQSNTFLTLSWLLVSLWLIAIIWSDNKVALVGKIDLTLAIPFMYFILYVTLLLYILMTIWKAAKNFSLPSIQYRNFLAAIEREAYSTRY